MSKNVDISRGIYKYVPQLLFEYFQKDKDMKVTLSKKKELVSKLWSVSETNSKYFSNNTYYLLLLSQ
mgnify:CR=1 FL=1